MTGIFIAWPARNYLPALATGDHGRDLLAYQSTASGKIPYRDYYWNFGPLMPYYYGLFFKLFGVKITSILLGKILMDLLAGIALYLGLAAFIGLPFAFLAAVWFWVYNPGFHYTFNHAGG
ncbi:MAG: hypothetical protein WCG06_06660, partial [Candidatus Omnitrophota bacterium]